MKPDLLCVWPQHLDFPLWRKQLHENRDRFNKVIIVFTDMADSPDYRDFLEPLLEKDKAIVVDNDNVLGDQDWRNIATLKAIQYSESDWLFFTEQDFFFKEDFWETVGTCPEDISVIGINIGGRLHPACLFIKRELLNKTNKDFGVVRDKLDHFGGIQEDIKRLGEKVCILYPELYEHLGGLSQNMSMLQRGIPPNYEPERFKQYLKDCLTCGVELHPDFIKLAKKYE